MHALTRTARALAATAALAAALPAAHALTVSSVEDGGNIVDTSLSTTLLAAVDVSFQTAAPVTLHFTLDEGEDGGTAGFNSILAFVANQSIDTVTLSLSNGATFVQIGAIEAINDASSVNALLSNGGSTASIALQPPTNEVYLGDPFAGGLNPDWRIGFGSLAAGQSFSMTISAVPEPAAWQQLAGGALVLGTLLQLRGRKGKGRR